MMSWALARFSFVKLNRLLSSALVRCYFGSGWPWRGWQTRRLTTNSLSEYQRRAWSVPFLRSRSPSRFIFRAVGFKRESLVFFWVLRVFQQRRRKKWETCHAALINMRLLLLLCGVLGPCTAEARGARHDPLRLSFEASVQGRLAALGDWNGDHWYLAFSLGVQSHHAERLTRNKVRTGLSWIRARNQSASTHAQEVTLYMCILGSHLLIFCKSELLDGKGLQIEDKMVLKFTDEPDMLIQNGSSSWLVSGHALRVQWRLILPLLKVLAVDFDYDGELDVILMGMKPRDPSVLYQRFFKGSSELGFGKPFLPTHLNFFFVYICYMCWFPNTPKRCQELQGFA
jgi:hypothetical protein